MTYIYTFLGWIMNWCYGICHNYGYAIVLFTLISKIILLPVSLWTYFESIKMIKIQPDINMLKVRFYGQRDLIADEQSKLFKKMKYHPVASIIPTILQLILLAGVVGVIKQGIGNRDIDMNFYGVNLGQIPSKIGLSLLWVPIAAGVSSWILCFTQNLDNVLQAEQSKFNKYGMMILSVGLSVYLGWYVSVGVAFYWVLSNLFAVLQMYICNWIIRPRRFVDYDKLEESRKQLKLLHGIGKKKESWFSENKKRERRDYKRFFKVVNKHLVFYSESNGFYKYMRDYIEYILKKTNVTIHYITSDPQDQIFELEKTNPKIRGYYIGENKLITLMMKMDADVVVMTMPDIENFHIKRSYVRKDIEYIFVPHGMGSNNLTMRKGCVDHFDTVFCVGPHQRIEAEQTEEIYNLPKKNLIDAGYPLLDNMRAQYAKSEKVVNEKKKILIAPSWQADNIIDSCLEELLNQIKDCGYDVIVRPHPQEVRLKAEHMKQLKEKYEPLGITVQTDFSSNNPVLEADLLITDWSDISMEFAFTKYCPVLFINTPMKIMNPEYQKISLVPINILLRDQVGKNIDVNHMDEAADKIKYLLDHSEEYRIAIEETLKNSIYYVDDSTGYGAEYIIQAIQKKIQERKG